ncbi:hypothetical protein [Vreelandella jeotgali]|uniref:hypothetical protein n=1 Tax=Vreelandella jeotgali TaxID=553386 RepID=UPI000347CAE5|nr:hypothetical protein [Halomonas jeotgali]
MRVELIDPNTWPAARGLTIVLVRILDSNPQYALIRCGMDQILVPRTAIRHLPDPEPVPAPPLQWGSIVTLTDGTRVLCTHPEVEMDGTWRGIPFHLRSIRTLYISDIAAIHHNQELTAA